MARPGNTIQDSAIAAAAAQGSRSGRWFVVDFAEKGPTGPFEVNSLSQFTGVYGGKVAWSFLADAAEVFFGRGGKSMIISRELGPAPVRASHMLAGSSGNTLQVLAKSAGAWGNALQVEVVVDTGVATINIYDAANNLIDSSLPQATEQALIDWSASSSYVDVVDQSGTGLPVALAKAALTGGDDDHVNGTDATAKAALDLFTKDLGPGTVTMLGRTTAQAHADTRAHCAANNRRGVMDLVDTATKSTLKSATAPQRIAADSGKAAVFTPWVKIAGTAPGTTRTLPPSPFVAAAIARNDAKNSPNVPVAGPETGLLGQIVGLTVSWTDDDTQELSCPELTFSTHGSINVLRVIDGVPQIYGNRTLTDPITDKVDLQLSNVRFDMFIDDLLGRTARGFVFRPIDGKGHQVAAYENALAGELAIYYADDSLFGDTAEDAFHVETDSVNDTDTAAAGQLIADVSYKRTPGAEEVVTRITRVAVDQPIAA